MSKKRTKPFQQSFFLPQTECLWCTLWTLGSPQVQRRMSAMHFLEAFPAASELQSARQGTPRRLESQSSQLFSGDRGRTHTGDKRFSEVRELLETMCCIWACRSCDRGGFSSLNSIKSQLLQCCRLSRPGSSPLSSVTGLPGKIPVSDWQKQRRVSWALYLQPCQELQKLWFL